ncbi:hypothetical protein ABW20_dc0104708 [Dactylellina cionopaga]|nr:hypothetical protein ABW20_dc0104708 [Dactylellina cionopaga]
MASDRDPSRRREYSNPADLLKAAAYTTLRHSAMANFYTRLSKEDRTLLSKANQKTRTHYSIGSFCGFCLGTFLALRRRRSLWRVFQNTQGRNQSLSIVYNDGRQEALADITPSLRPSFARGVATYVGFGIAGMFAGGMVGGMTGTRARRKIFQEDPGAVRRINSTQLNCLIHDLKSYTEEVERLNARQQPREAGDRPADGTDTSWPPPESPNWPPDISKWK